MPRAAPETRAGKPWSRCRLDERGIIHSSLKITKYYKDYEAFIEKDAGTLYICKNWILGSCRLQRTPTRSCTVRVRIYNMMRYLCHIIQLVVAVTRGTSWMHSEPSTPHSLSSSGTVCALATTHPQLVVPSSPSGNISLF